MARAKIFDDEEALETAMRLFWAKGYEATSIHALEQATGLKRTSLYHAFGNKRALFVSALNLYFDKVLAKFLGVIENAPTARQAVEAMLAETIALHFTPSHPGGCLIVLSLAESRQHDPETRALLNRALARLRDGLAQRFDRAMDEGELPAGTDCGALADQIVATIAGLIIMAKADVPQERLAATARLAAAALPAAQSAAAS